MEIARVGKDFALWKLGSVFQRREGARKILKMLRSCSRRIFEREITKEREGERVTFCIIKTECLFTVSSKVT